MENKIKAIIFDLGGVLFLARDPEKRKGKNLHNSLGEGCILLEGIPKEKEKFTDKILKIYGKSSLGKISKLETCKLLSKELGISPEEVKESFEKVYRRNTIENKKLYKYILNLKKKGYKLGILSTQFHLSKSALISKKYYEDFNALEISCEDKLRKPDKKSFDLILKRLNVLPNQAIFIDDKKENVEQAIKLGMKGIFFIDNNQFFKEIKKLII